MNGQNICVGCYMGFSKPVLPPVVDMLQDKWRREIFRKQNKLVKQLNGADKKQRNNSV
jgi:hypothetical protein